MRYTKGNAMEKILILSALLCFGGTVFAAEAVQVKAESKNDLTLQQPLSDKERQKIFKARGKKMRKLAKKYRKATAEQKMVIKAELTAIVSEAVDAGVAFSKRRIADTKANLALWEAKLKEQEADLDAVKAKRVDDILSGEAQRRYDLAKKRWKQEIKNLKTRMK